MMIPSCPTFQLTFFSLPLSHLVTFSKSAESHFFLLVALISKHDSMQSHGVLSLSPSFSFIPLTSFSCLLERTDGRTDSFSQMRLWCP